MPQPQQMAAKDEEWNINAHLKQSEAFEKLFGINVSVQEGLHVQGTVNAGSGRTSLSVFANQSMLLDKVLHVPAFTSAEQIAYTIALFKHIKNFRDENIALQPIYPLLMGN